MRSSRLGAGSELEPVPVLFPQLHCLPGCVASFTLNRGKADPSEKGSGNPQAGTWVLTMNDLQLQGMGCAFIAHSHLELYLPGLL